MAQPKAQGFLGPGGRSVPTEKSYPLMTRSEIETMIAHGRKLIIVDQHVLKVDSWLPYHPGGAKSIMHMVGRDATDEVNWFVAPSPGFTRWSIDTGIEHCDRPILPT